MSSHFPVWFPLQDRPTPLLIDISGTAYAEKQRPPTLKQSHIDAFYWRVAQGLPAMLKVRIQNCCS